MGEIVRKISLPIVASTMTAELHAILLALGIINEPQNAWGYRRPWLGEMQSFIATLTTKLV